MKTELALGCVGTGLSTIGTIAQTNEILQTISLIITICGALVSFIVIPVLTWYKNAKKDGKITTDELIEGAKTIEDGIKKTEEEIKKGDKK